MQSDKNPDQQPNIPLRLHHNAYVVRDQRVTRRFYEDLIGLPLAACWTERDEVFGGMRVYCHTFYELADGGRSLSFNSRAKPITNASARSFDRRPSSTSRSRRPAKLRPRSPSGSSRPDASTLSSSTATAARCM